MTETTEDTGTNALAEGDSPVIDAPEAVIDAPETVVDETPETEVKPHHNKGRTPWYMERINEETNKRRAIEDQLAQKAREAEESRALLERLQNGDKQPSNVRTETPQDEEAKIEARAALKLLQRDSATVRNAGIRAYPDFSDSLKVLTSVGATSDDFVQDLIDTDMASAHKMIDFLAKDPDRALELVNMSSKRRVAELTRISMSELNKPAPVVAPKVAISKVPAPKPVIDAVSDDSGETDLTNDKLDDSTWSKLWDKKYKKRA
jgi:hypothetical protein